jgi:hypothetical protein
MTAGPYLALPFLLQGFIMMIDEFHFHRLRGLGRWERISHPIDTLSVLLAYSWLLRFPPSEGHRLVYLSLCSLSCLSITKDEAVHARECGPVEHWLHSLLFILHPVTFIAAHACWPALHDGSSEVRQAATLIIAMIGLLLLYQTAFWNLSSTKEPA